MTPDTITNITTGKQYRKISYTLDGVREHTLHVFTTLGKTRQRLVPIVCSSKTSLEAMNPNTAIASATDVVAKINGNVFDAGPIGINYEGAGGKLYIAAGAYTSAPQNSYTYDIQDKQKKFSPSFCAKSDGTATIRWFKDANALQQAMNASTCIIAGAHPLVFRGKVVTDEIVYDNEPADYSKVIYNAADQSDTRFNDTVIAAGVNGTALRALLGHKSGSQGIYMLVCSETYMTIRESAKLMKRLGCDYAVNLDGNHKVQMRIKSGYGPSGISGKVTKASKGDQIYAGIAVYDI